MHGLKLNHIVKRKIIVFNLPLQLSASELQTRLLDFKFSTKDGYVTVTSQLNLPASQFVSLTFPAHSDKLHLLQLLILLIVETDIVVYH